MGVVADIERQLGRLRAREEDDGTPDLRTSTMTHIVWCPPKWRPKARATLAGLLERHPARTIFLIPTPGSEATIDSRVELKDFELQGLSREVLSEVIELRLGGSAAKHPGSIVLPLLVSDLPVFCRWRGEPSWGSVPLAEIVGLTDRLVVDSSEWRASAEGLYPARAAVRKRRRLGHRLLAHTAVAPPARRAMAGDQDDREAARRRPTRRRGARRRLAPLAAEARDRADAAGRSRGEGDVGRR